MTGGFQLGLEGFQPFGLFGQTPFGVVRRGVEFLQRNEPFEISVHDQWRT
jgi:hypothetical protein